jgi:hypothetical protein
VSASGELEGIPPRDEDPGRARARQATQGVGMVSFLSFFFFLAFLFFNLFLPP